MAGNINRPSLTDLSFDFETFKLAKNLLLNKTGDDGLLVSIKKYFHNNGFSYFDWKKHCPELFANKDILTQIKPSKIAQQNLHKAISIFRSFGEIDVGQSMIVQNKIVLGLEAVEGTDNLIVRCKEYKKSGEAIRATPDQLQEALKSFINKLNKESYPKNISHYEPPHDATIPLRVDYLKFENLQAELNQFLASLDISESVTLPHLKKGQNLPVEAILDIADSEQLKIINDYFDDEFKVFGYQKLEAHPSP